MRLSFRQRQYLRTQLNVYVCRANQIHKPILYTQAQATQSNEYSSGALFLFVRGIFIEIYSLAEYINSRTVIQHRESHHIGPGLDAIGRKREGTNMILLLCFVLCVKRIDGKSFQSKKNEFVLTPELHRKIIICILERYTVAGVRLPPLYVCTDSGQGLFFGLARKKCAAKESMI